MKLTFGCGFGFAKEMERNEVIFGPSNLSLKISSLGASKVQDHKIEWI